MNSIIAEREDEDQNTTYFDSRPNNENRNFPEEIKLNQTNSSKNKVIIQVLSKKTDKNERQIFYKNFKIGRSSENDLRLIPKKKLGIYPDISDIHCTVKLNAENSFQLEDCESEFGTFFQLIPKQKYILQEGETYSIGATLLTIAKITDKALEISVFNDENKDKIFKDKGKKFKIGTDSDNDLPLKDKLVSKVHCIIKKKDNGGFILRDRGSTNGFIFFFIIKKRYYFFKDMEKIEL